ncbi:asparagine synthase (glutamine-hydrolyzing) [Pedobacter agri]|uniref:asparagine synthase (glutamine-hydrolyzing) n=1 Tax=Pedobacter agri TaxID=454586 RepID=A0A9X3DD38_9SPHI|nr:asparagine synthase (glutamine-hydrolyzing) [Pedobacter agri]MCX3263628.1 asparagine synthase (glutamine-hydrolyzing) [Pedobacter agri]
MCRIAGIIDQNQSPAQLEKDVQAMCDSMKHGGPDDEGFFADPKIGLQFGHRRLALIDLSPTGYQPMRYNQGNLTITFNGEIYNYLELKTELTLLGLIFNTESDTEVILAAYQTWGTASFHKLTGMFAFAIYDQLKQVTHLVRDQMGIKPLYFSSTDTRLIFASEVKAFEKTSYRFEENADWKIYFLAFGHLPHPFTTLKDVHSLRPGHFLTWDHQEQTFQINSFENIGWKKTIFNNQDASKKIEQELSKAVNRQLIADAPVGVFLSGGIDSSIITLIANQKIGSNLNSLSINFQEKQFSEAQFQQAVADQTHGTHHSYQVKKEDLEVHFKEILSAMDQPTNDGINSWFVNRYAKVDGLKAVLSGIGADELFGGYPSFKRMKLIQKMKRFPRFLLKSATFLRSERLKRIAYLSYQNPIGEYLFLRGFFVPDTIAKILQIDKHRIDALLEAFPIDKSMDVLDGEERASWMETHLFMQNQLLKDTDFMSMSHGVEVRVPFLDQRFLNSASGIAHAQRFHNRPKGLLIDAFKHILPEIIWNRPKMGFTFPLQQWLQQGTLITNENQYSGYSVQLIRKFKTGKLHWSKAFALFQIANSNS